MDTAAAAQRSQRMRALWLRAAAAGLAVVTLTGAVGIGSGSLSFATFYLAAFSWWIGLPQALHMVLAERLPSRHRLLRVLTPAVAWCAGGAVAGTLLPFYGASRWQGAVTTAAGALIALTMSTALTTAVLTGSENDPEHPVSQRAARLNRRVRVGVLALTALIIIAAATTWTES